MTIEKTSPLSSALRRQSESVLEWQDLLRILATHACSSLGAESCLALPLEESLEVAQARQQETSEMREVLEGATPFPLLTFQDIHGVLARSVKGALLEGQELRDISTVIGLGQEAKRCLHTTQQQLQSVWEIVLSLDEQAWVKHAIDRCIDQEGHIRESATPELHELIQQTQHLRRKMRNRLEAILASTRYEEILQGQYFAQREERYVIPVKAERQHEVPGIVHDISSSGATVFLEPRELIDLNNAIKVGDLHVAQEVRRILQELSSMIAEHAEILRRNLEILVTLDCLSAKARLSQRMDGHPITLNDQKRIHLLKARHPLLILNKEEVVPNDILIDEQTQVLVISGPNTGGKTVTLKLIGLVSLMIRTGLHPPCAEGSSMAVFPRVYADIGDAQDLTKDLSSFSAHMSHMIQFLNEMAGKEDMPLPASLILLDEIGSSTDPTEGAALAEALLSRLFAMGCKVVVTTHYHSLKAMALKKTGFLNASHEFDLQTLSPTYRLLIGLPGGSSALDIAGRLGLDPAILKQAVSLIEHQNRDLDQVFHHLQETQGRLQRELEQAKCLRAEADELFQKAQEIEEGLRTREREERQKVRRTLQQELTKAKQVVHGIMEEFKKDKTLVKAKTVLRRLSEVQTEATRLVSSFEAPPVSSLGEGDLVELKTLGSTGVLLEAPHGKKRVKIRVAKKVISVDVSLLQGAPQSPAPSTAVKRPSPSSSNLQPPQGISEQALTASNTVDLRGTSTEEAQEMIVAAFDRSMLEGVTVIRVIHGHGSGKLKNLVRSYCSDSPYVSQFRAGEREEGGDGVTIVELK
ncbi:MAG: endonuclease MutS2 [Nitrospirota bacterium]|nr:MAG: endonuclease MutS2 [Nitrospirota bacterium]